MKYKRFLEQLGHNSTGNNGESTQNYFETDNSLTIPYRITNDHTYAIRIKREFTYMNMLDMLAEDLLRYKRKKKKNRWYAGEGYRIC